MSCSSRDKASEDEKAKFLDPSGDNAVESVDEDEDEDEEEEFFGVESPENSAAPRPPLRRQPQRLFFLKRRRIHLNPKRPKEARYVRKWILRQAFMDAVNSLPILSASDISKVCADYDEEDDDTAGDSDDEDEVYGPAQQENEEEEGDGNEDASSQSGSNDGTSPQATDALLIQMSSNQKRLRKDALSKHRLLRSGHK